VVVGSWKKNPCRAEGCEVYLYMSGCGNFNFSPFSFSSVREIMVWQNEVHWSKRYCDLPCHKIVPLSRKIFAAATGPKEGVRNIPPGHEPFGRWTERQPRAYGIGTSLYECDPVTTYTSGDPIADVYAVVAGENSSILALADGVGWGEKSRLAARCAVAGCLQYLSSHLYTANTTCDILSILLNAFHHAQEFIKDNNATTTTLCVAVICQLKASERWGLCVVNVGDSLAFTYKTSKGVQEVTIGSHYDNEERDMSNPGGSLGPVDGYNPDLRNLTFSFTVLDSGDIVFLTSDGISDNFDPIIVPCTLCEIPGDHGIPQHQAYDPPIARHKTMLDDMTKVYVDREKLIPLSRKLKVHSITASS